MNGKKKFRYRKNRVVCNGTIKGCEHCKDISPPAEGYCPMCGRPLWKRIGEACNFILGYVECPGPTQGKIDFRCYQCNTIITRKLTEE
jgi:hypothetical protein